MGRSRHKTTVGIPTGLQMEFEWRSEATATGTRLTITRSMVGGERRQDVLAISESEARELCKFLNYVL